MQDVTQSSIFSCGTDTSLISSDAAEKQVYAQTTSLYSQYTQVADSKIIWLGMEAVKQTNNR